MKKFKYSLILFTCTILFLLSGCSNIEYQANEYKFTKNYIYAGNIIYKTSSTCSEGDQIDFNQLILPSNLYNSYFILDYYKDITMQEKFIREKVYSDYQIFIKLEKYTDSNNCSIGNNINSEFLVKYLDKHASKITEDSMNIDLFELETYKELGYGSYFYKIDKTSSNSIYSRTNKFYYFPESKKCIVTYISENKQQISGTNFANIYGYSGNIEFSLGETMNLTKYYGIYKQVSINTKTYNINAEYTAKINYSINKLKLSTCELPDIELTSYSGSITNATDYEQANKHFNLSTAAKSCYSNIKSALNLLSQISYDSNNGARIIN